MLKKIFLFGVFVWLNWTAFIVMLAVNIIRAIIDKTPFIPWLGIGLWLIANISIAILTFKYARKNAGKIAAGTIKDGMKFANETFGQLDREMKK